MNEYFLDGLVYFRAWCFSEQDIGQPTLKHFPRIVGQIDEIDESSRDLLR